MAEYFSPRAKQRLCFSQYNGAGHMLGTLPQVSFFISLFFFVTPTVLSSCFVCRVCGSVISAAPSLEKELVRVICVPLL